MSDEPKPTALVTVDLGVEGKTLWVRWRSYWGHMTREEAMELLEKLPAEIAKLPVKLP